MQRTFFSNMLHVPAPPGPSRASCSTGWCSRCMMFKTSNDGACMATGHVPGGVWEAWNKRGGRGEIWRPKRAKNVRSWSVLPQVRPRRCHVAGLDGGAAVARRQHHARPRPRRVRLDRPGHRRRPPPRVVPQGRWHNDSPRNFRYHTLGTLVARFAGPGPYRNVRDFQALPGLVFHSGLSHSLFLSNLS